MELGRGEVAISESEESGEQLADGLTELRYEIDKLELLFSRMSELPASLVALQAGRIGFAHLTAMTRTADAVGERFNESALIEKAEENSAGKFHYVCRHYRHSADAQGYAAEQAEQVENRRLSLSRWEDGSYLISGVLDAVGGAALRTALEPLARKSGAHDERSRERRV